MLPAEPERTTCSKHTCRPGDCKPRPVFVSAVRLTERTLGFQSGGRGATPRRPTIPREAQVLVAAPRTLNPGVRVRVPRASLLARWNFPEAWCSGRTTVSKTVRVGSIPTASAVRIAPVVERQSRRLAKSETWVRFPPGALITSPWSSLECSPPCQGGDRGFKSRRGRFVFRNGDVAQLVAGDGLRSRLVWVRIPPSPLLQTGRRSTGSHKPGLWVQLPGLQLIDWVGQSVEPAGREPAQCGFDSHPGHFGSVVQQEDSRLASGESGCNSLRNPLFETGREPDNGSPDRTANARGHTWSEGSIPSPSAQCPGGETDDHAALRTRCSRFESWPGYSVRCSP